MVKTLPKAIAELAGLPDADQEVIGRKLLTHVGSFAPCAPT